MCEGCGMDLWNEAKQSGIKEGILKGKEAAFAKNVFSLSRKLEMPYVQSMEILDVPLSLSEKSSFP